MAAAVPSPVTPARVNDAEGQGTGTSAWNQAGTFEERVYTDWLKKRMVELVDGREAGGVQLSSCSVDQSSGAEATPMLNASVVFARGKKKIGYEFSMKGDWSSEGARGTFKLPYVCDDVEDQLYEVVITAKSGDPPPRDALRDVFRAVVAEMAAELRAK
eukprot:TRINITY_DN3908_c0_g1_i4.p1 TRINITY_DN3908_c0_g1~~TRINITY_DN3908_c0_g1_i4.p1  ORF type:complete len:159 (+),score=35.71 TRINITY_DN3908_c0_g1_i4:181-657(+)